MKKKLIILTSLLIVISALVYWQMNRYQVQSSEEQSQLAEAQEDVIQTSSSEQANLENTKMLPQNENHECLQLPLKSHCYDTAVEQWRHGDKVLARSILNLSCADGHIPSCYRVRDYEKACRFGDTHACKIKNGRKRLVPFEIPQGM